MATFTRTNIDLKKNFIRGAARIVIADMVTPVATKLADVIRLTTAGQANEVQTGTITGTPTGGTFRLTYKGYTTSALAFNATNATVQTALQLLSSVGSGGIVVAGAAGGPYTFTFSNQLGNQSLPLLVADSTGFTGGTTPLMTITRTTAGVGKYDAISGYTDLGATKGGITINRNNSEEVFTVDQILSDILALPTAWEMNVSASFAQADIDTISYLWESGTITLDAGTGERTMPLGAPIAYRQKRLVVLFQRQSYDGGLTEGLIRGYIFRITQRSPAESSITHNREGDQAIVPFTWKAIADDNVQDEYARFGAIVDQG